VTTRAGGGDGYISHTTRRPAFSPASRGGGGGACAASRAWATSGDESSIVIGGSAGNLTCFEVRRLTVPSSSRTSYTSGVAGRWRFRLYARCRDGDWRRHRGRVPLGPSRIKIGHERDFAAQMRQVYRQHSDAVQFSAVRRRCAAR